MLAATRWIAVAPMPRDEIWICVMKSMNLEPTAVVSPRASNCPTEFLDKSESDQVPRIGRILIDDVMNEIAFDRSPSVQYSLGIKHNGVWAITTVWAMGTEGLTSGDIISVRSWQ